MADEKPWYRSTRGVAVVAVYAVLTLLALALTTDPEPVKGVFFPNATANESAIDRPEMAIPAFVYLYAFLGAMAYAFTSVVAKFERDTRGVIRVGLRALAALPLAAGVFLLAGALGLKAAPIAGVAFLVGLYVNLTLKSLGALADRLYGRVPGNRSDDGSSAGTAGEADEGGGGGPETE